MDNANRTVRPKIGLLRLADKLGSVTRACEVLGYSRDSYYRFKALYERGGADALRDISRRKPVFKNRVPGDVERAVLQFSFAHPTQGQHAVATALAAEGVRVSSSGVRSIWMRSEIETFEKRIFAILAKCRQDGFPLSPEQEAAVARARKLGRLKPGRFIERPGEVCYHDLVSLGAHPRLGQLSVMTFTDAYSHVAFAVAMRDAAPVSPVDFLRERVLPWFRERRVTIDTVRSDRRPPFTMGGRTGYAAFLKKQGTAHVFRLTKAAHRGDAGSDFVDLVRRELFHPLLRTETDMDFAVLEDRLAQWVADHNQRRPWQGASCFGKTPAKTFEDATRFQPRRG